MQDMKASAEKLRTETDYAEQIARSATDLQKRGVGPRGSRLEPLQRTAAYRLLAAFLILKSSIRLPEPNFATSQRGCLPRPAQVSEG